MEALGVLPFIISHVLNHVSEMKSGATGKHYQRHEYLAEKRAALDLWAEHLQIIVSGESRPMKL